MEPIPLSGMGSMYKKREYIYLTTPSLKQHYGNLKTKLKR